MTRRVALLSALVAPILSLFPSLARARSPWSPPFDSGRISGDCVVWMLSAAGRLSARGIECPPGPISEIIENGLMRQLSLCMPHIRRAMIERGAVEGPALLKLYRGENGMVRESTTYAIPVEGYKTILGENWSIPVQNFMRRTFSKWNWRTDESA